MDSELLQNEKKQKRVKEDKSINFKSLFKQRDPESSFILLIVPIILTIWVYYGKQVDFHQVFKGFDSRWNQDFYSAVYEYLTAFLLMFWVPFFIVRMFFKKQIREYGFRKGDGRYGWRFIALVLPLFVWAAYVGSSGSGIQSEYPLAKSSMGHIILFIVVEVFYLVYYVSWEFLFRGFMLFGLEKRFGASTAILIQMIPSAIIHVGKPASESFGAIFAGLAFGYLAIRTRSIFYPLILHAVIGIGTDVFVTLRLIG